MERIYEIREDQEKVVYEIVEKLEKLGVDEFSCYAYVIRLNDLYDDLQSVLSKVTICYLDATCEDSEAVEKLINILKELVEEYKFLF